METYVKANLKELIDYLNDRNSGFDRAKFLIGTTVTALAIGTYPTTGAVANLLTIMGESVNSEIKGLFNLFNKDKNEEEIAIRNREMCEFVEIAIAKLAVKYAVTEILEGKEKLMVSWKIEKQLKDDDIAFIDEKRESKYATGFNEGRTFNREEYWNDFIHDIQKAIRIEELHGAEFKEKLMEQIKSNYLSFNIMVKKFSPKYEAYLEEITRDEIDDIRKGVNTLTKSIEIPYKYKSIEEVNQWLKDNTSPTISLQFFNYEEESFIQSFKEALSQDVIYLQGKTREEVVYYILWILKNIDDEKIQKDTFIIESIEDWNNLKGKCKDKILVPNFSASEVSVISDNKNIIVFSEEDFVGNKNPIKLQNRIKNNMYEKFKNEDIPLEIVSKIVDDCSGLFSIFKRQVFQGKLAKPNWEAKYGKELIPALLLGKWTNGDGDQEIVAELGDQEYKEYLESINTVIGGSDPFLLKMSIYNNTTYKIANVEEAWEILFKIVSEKYLESFRDIVSKVILSIDPKFEYHPSEHFKLSLRGEEPKYSLVLKEGIIRSLIMLANNSREMQFFVDAIMEEILGNVTSEKDWFGISDLLGLSGVYESIIGSNPSILGLNKHTVLISFINLLYFFSKFFPPTLKHFTTSSSLLSPSITLIG